MTPSMKMPSKPAGGAFPMPKPFGAPDEPDNDEMGGPPDGDEDDQGESRILVQALHYHSEPHSCGICKHYQDGNCAILKMPVADEGGCAAFESGGGTGQPDEAQGSMFGGGDETDHEYR